MALQELQLISPPRLISPIEADASLPIAMLALMVAMMALGFSAYTFAKLRDLSEKASEPPLLEPLTPPPKRPKMLSQALRPLPPSPQPIATPVRSKVPIRLLEGQITEEEGIWLQRIAQGPYGAVGRALGWVYVQGSHWSGALEQPDQWQQACVEGMLPRLEHFLEVQSGERKIEDWVERDLIAALNMLAQLLSVAAAEAHTGSPMAEILTERVGRLLYEELHQACMAEGWFGLIPVWPFRTPFDPRLHLAVGSDAIAGAGIVVEIRRIGFFHPHTQTVRNLAQVVIGR